MLVSFKELKGSTINAVDGDIGEVKDVYFDDRYWVVRFLVVDTQPWIPLSLKTLISPIALQEFNADEQTLAVNISKDMIKECPKVEEHQTVSREFEMTYYDYFGYGYYWMGDENWGEYAHPTALATRDVQILQTEQREEKKKTNHLRSANEIVSYGIDAVDGKKGHVKEIILDTQTWSIQYLVIDTRDWLPGGKKVLVSPDQLTSLSWLEQSVSCNINLEQIKQCPEYEPDKLNDLQYQQQVRNKLQVNE